MYFFFLSIYLGKAVGHLPGEGVWSIYLGKGCGQGCDCLIYLEKGCDRFIYLEKGCEKSINLVTFGGFN